MKLHKMKASSKCSSYITPVQINGTHYMSIHPHVNAKQIGQIMLNHFYMISLNGKRNIIRTNLLTCRFECLKIENKNSLVIQPDSIATI